MRLSYFCFFRHFGHIGHYWRKGSDLPADGMRGLYGIVLSIIVAVSVLPPAGAQETVGRLREEAFAKYGDGEFADALPYFQQLIDIQGTSKDRQVIASLERIYYNAAMCHFLTADFAGAEKTFKTYAKVYPRGILLHEALVYIGDAQRFGGSLDKAIKSYQQALRRFTYPTDLRTDIYAAIARCYLARDDWAAARDPLLKAFACAPDIMRRNRAATLLATAYLKTLELEEIYRMVPHLLQRDSLASRSIAFNMAALEAGDELFGEERYREAFWIHRLVYPHDELLVRTQAFLDYLQRRILHEQRYFTNPRRLMRLQEWLSDTEAELKAIEAMDNYDPELLYRIARGYMEAKRFREGCELFLHLNAIGGRDRAEESLFYAFMCATHVPPRSRAYEIGRRYMDEYPGGEWYDPLTLMMGQMMANEKDWPAVIRHFSEVLQVRPNHQQAAECLYLLGYAHFMQEEFEQALTRLKDLRQRFPQSPLMPDAVYWSAMAAMFDGDYEPAGRDFDELLQRYGDSRYATDASFRRAVCNYALGEYDDAEARLASFVSQNPTNSLVGEAEMTRGDIAGAVGRIDDAVSHYQRAMNSSTNDLNIEYFNHCAFQAGQILFDHERYAEVRSHFQRYLEMNRPESNQPLAIYWIGRSMWQMGEVNGTIRFYRDAVLKYGKDRLAVGVDMILDEWVAATRRTSPAVAAAAWQDVAMTMRNARSRNDRVTELRFQRLLLFHPDAKPSEKERVLDALLQPENIANASPAVMETMLDAAIARAQTNLAIKVANAIVADFTETDYALEARMFLAQCNLAAARSQPEGSITAKGLMDAAMGHLNIVRGVFASSDEAARALLLLGEIHREQQRFEEADRCYQDVLGVRGWRNHWPVALTGRGLCAEAKREWIKAAAFYERIYVMYSGYREATAKAYLRRAICLHRGYEDAKAIEVLHAMLDNEDLKIFAEYEQARRLLAQLGGSRP